jgi:lipopolysaccharide transport system ATP-binding protein
MFSRYSVHRVLDAIYLDVYRGETLGVLGNNGAGKSTLLRVMSGVISPDHGEINNRGHSVSLLALQAGFDPNLTGRQNAIFAAMLYGFSRKNVERKLQYIHEFSELGESFFEPVRTYSTGMVARLGFSVANIMSPDVLLIDEVLAVGDYSFRKKAERTMVGKIQSDQTIILVSHSLNQLHKLCDRVMVIHNGKQITCGSPEHSISAYKSIQTNIHD